MPILQSGSECLFSLHKFEHELFWTIMNLQCTETHVGTANCSWFKDVICRKSTELANWWLNGVVLKGRPVGRVYVVCQLTAEANIEISNKGQNSSLQVRVHLLVASNSYVFGGLGWE